MKTCTGCSTGRDESEFMRQSHGRNGLTAECKPCHKSRVAEWRSKNQEKVRAYARKSYAANGRKPPSRSPIPLKFSEYRRSSKSRGMGEFGLTRDEFMMFWQRPCYYCASSIKTIGLDRVDNSKPYSMSNVVSCCPTCNRAKSTLSKSEFVALCYAVVRQHEQRAKDIQSRDTTQEA